MEVEEAIAVRRSVRSYQPKEVPEELIRKVLEAARLAPSARNRQDWQFIVVRSEKRELLYEASDGQTHVREAPVILAGVTTEPGLRMKCGIPSGIVDVAIALDHLTLKAAEEGLGTCWIGHFDQAKAKEALGVPKGCEIVSLMTLGWPREPLKRLEKPRKNLAEIVGWESFG